MSLRKTGFPFLAWAVAACACLYFTPAVRGWGGCPVAAVAAPVVFTAASTPAPDYAWERWPDGSAAWKLRDRSTGVCAGVWQDGSYYPWLGHGAYGPAAAPPIDPPAAPDAPIFGVLPEKIVPDRTTITDAAGTHAVSTAEAIKAVAAGVPDDRNKLRLTFIGAEPDCTADVKDVAGNPLLAPFTASVIVQDFRADDWQVKDAGFVTDGKPVRVYLQQPDGKVLLDMDHYDAAALAAELRKRDPHYDPAKDPNGATPASMWGEIVVEVQKVPPWVWAAFVILAFIAVVRRKA